MDNQYQEHEQRPAPLNPLPQPPPEPLPPQVIIVKRELGLYAKIAIVVGIVAGILVIIGMIFAIKGLMGG